MSNNKIILEGCISQYKKENQLDISESDLFELFVLSQITKNLNITFENIIDSVVDGSGDGGEAGELGAERVKVRAGAHAHAAAGAALRAAAAAAAAVVHVHGLRVRCVRRRAGRRQVGAARRLRGHEALQVHLRHVRELLLG